MKNFIKTKISQHCCKSFNGTKTGFHLSAAYFQSLKLRLKGIYKHIFSDPSCGDGNARFTAVHLKPLSVQTSKLWKKQLFSDLKCLFLRVSPLFFNSKCTSHHKWTKILISNSYLIRQRYKGYRSKSDIVRLARRFTCNNAYSPFNCLNHLGISCIKYSFYQQKINSSIKKSSSLLTISFN